MAPSFERDEYGKIGKVWVSARHGDGLELIRQALAERHEKIEYDSPELVAG